MEDMNNPINWSITEANQIYKQLDELNSVRDAYLFLIQPSCHNQEEGYHTRIILTDGITSETLREWTSHSVEETLTIMKTIKPLINLLK